MSQLIQEQITEPDASHVIGITGGVGAGKSSVLAILENTYKAHIIVSDNVAHRLMEPGGRSYLALLSLLGEEILSEPEGAIDHRKMAAKIFDRPDLLAQVNAITHPLVIETITEEIAACRAEGISLIVVETALPVPGSLDTWCDAIWYVYVPDEIRIDRLMASRGYTREKCLDIMARQFSDADYRQISAAVIDNSGSTEATADQIAGLIGALS